MPTVHASYTDYPVGRSVDELLRLVDAFQFVQKVHSREREAMTGRETERDREIDHVLSRYFFKLWCVALTLLLFLCFSL